MHWRPGSARSPLGSLSAPSDPLAEFQEKGIDGKRKNGWEGEGNGREGKRRERKTVTGKGGEREERPRRNGRGKREKGRGKYPPNHEILDPPLVLTNNKHTL